MQRRMNKRLRISLSHRTLRLILSISFYLLLVGVMYIGSGFISYGYRLGDRVEEEVLAPSGFRVGEKTFEKGEVLISRGETMSMREFHILYRLAGHRPFSEKAYILSGIIILIALLMGLIGIHLVSYEPEIWKDNSKLLLVGLIILLMVILAKWMVLFVHLPGQVRIDYLIPIAVASMLIAILLNSRVAVMTVVVISILVGTITGWRLEIVGVLLAGGIVGAFSMRRVRRRARLLMAGLPVGLVNLVAIVGIGYWQGNTGSLLKDGALGLASGIISAFIIAAVLPIFEYTFRITTDISLLEFSDLSHPLLKELMLKAAGTYHHSLIVGNLAEAACETIGANSLLARVGSYYHDIGKIEKASYFSENQKGGKGTHKRLAPSMSTLIIINHVKRGIELARKNKLRDAIIDFISQHHGTSMVHYFYLKALGQGAKEDSKIDEASFRYPGPKPQTKETAVVMLADAVEATSRTLEEPIPSRIDELVKKTINNKFIDGQLDECELTLRDINKISSSFMRILTGVFHSRVKYLSPKTQGEEKSESPDKDTSPKPQNKPDGDKEAG